MPDPKLLVPAVTAEAMPKIIRHNTIVIVHVWAKWNPYDYQLDAWLSSCQPEFPGEKFFSLDSGPETEWEFLRQHHITTLPVLLCFLNGIRHETYVGLNTEAELKSKLRAWSVTRSS